MSVVIPTRNRPESLRRLVASLAAQERPPDEVIIVDASDEVDERVHDAFRSKLDHIEVVRARPHLCRQRNEGIRLARGSHVFLCDDDVELPPRYLGRLLDHLEAHPEDGAVTGPFRDRTGPDVFGASFPVPSAARLLHSFVFQLTVWGDVEATRSAGLLRLPLERVRAFYRRRGNTWSLAGWPLVTQVRNAVVHAAVYTLGAAVVRRDWLLNSPYDERLGPQGIGDHYGVAMAFPRCPGIALLPDLEVMHHRAPEERLTEPDAYLARILALDLFTHESSRFHGWNRLFLIWSLIGSAMVFALQGRWTMLGQALRAIVMMALGTNPLRRRTRVAPPATRHAM